jgi:pyruvate dehydrogenase E2 component (dihydrolipoamide acetyltransferase)
MAAAITVPRLGWSMDEGTFVEWLKHDGEPVAVGEALFVLEGEKAAENIEAIDAGILHIPLHGPNPGDVVKVGQVLAYLVAEGDTVPAELSRDQEGRGATASRLAGSRSEDVVKSVAPVPDSTEVIAGRGELGASAKRQAGSQSLASTAPSLSGPVASPRARRVAQELGIDWTTLLGSGRTGRIRERDVRAAARAPAADRLVPHTAARKIIAARMVAAVTVAAPVTLTTKADVTDLVQLRRKIQVVARSAEETVPTFTDFFLAMTAAALRQHPLLQAQWREDGLFVPEGIHLGLAVDTEAGLLVPVVRDADRLTVRQIAARTRELAARARAGQLSGEQLRGGTFTVTNLGHFGIDAFTPLLHLPQSAILGIGRIVREPAVVEEQIVPRDRVTLSLTFDHRVTDGAPAARFLDTLRRLIEQPGHLLER